MNEYEVDILLRTLYCLNKGHTRFKCKSMISTGNICAQDAIQCVCKYNEYKHVCRQVYRAQKRRPFLFSVYLEECLPVFQRGISHWTAQYCMSVLL